VTPLAEMSALCEGGKHVLHQSIIEFDPKQEFAAAQREFGCLWITGPTADTFGRVDRDPVR
jgi:hypothetical protein